MRDYKKRLEQVDPWSNCNQCEVITERALLARFCFGVVFGFCFVYGMAVFILSL